MHWVNNNRSNLAQNIIALSLNFMYNKENSGHAPEHTNQEGGPIMKITDVRIRKVTAEGKMKAIVSVTFDDEFVVHDIKIIDGQNGLFIAMPSRKMGEGDFRDIAHPLTSETRNRIKDAIFAEYDKLLAEQDIEES